MNFEKLAQSGAKKLCGIGTCRACFECVHENKGDFLLDLIGTETVCPLEKYHIIPEEMSEPWWKRPMQEIKVTEDEIFALCSKCKNGKVKKEGRDMSVERPDYMKCIDCPVLSAEEAMLEAEAEICSL